MACFFFLFLLGRFETRYFEDDEELPKDSYLFFDFKVNKILCAYLSILVHRSYGNGNGNNSYFRS